MLYVDAKVWLPEDLLMKADKITTFLDHELVEFTASLPLALKRSGATGKVLLRKAMRGRIPDVLIDRPQKGFPVPTESWLSS